MRSVTNGKDKVVKFANVIRPFAANTAKQLAKARKADLARGRHPAWPWIDLVLSYATLGGSRNWEVNIEPRAEDFGWARISKLSAKDRKKLLLQLPNPRFRVLVAGHAEAAFQMFKKAGGPTTIRNRYRKLQTAEERLDLLQQFPGIGQKYARNIAMEVCDDLVCNHFALDHRLKALIGPFLRPNFSYREGEEFLRTVAALLNVDARTLDRTLYRNYDEIKLKLTH